MKAIWNWLLNPDNRGALQLIGGAVAAAVVAAWAVFTFVYNPDNSQSVKDDRPYGISWWKERVGKAITQDDYLKGFGEIVGDKIKKGILLKVELKSGQNIIGYLDASVSGGEKGYVYTFVDKFGKYHSFSPSDISQVLVEMVDEVTD